ncbi:metallophosphoesterase family protein [Rhodalgimonas zhirmunskyi]|uniref:Metallophosphatase family protein n=1 Tax=Rhodalgimonas zhirmunskyi TaxID=2964767 RepID=A0AAJ1U6H9_9RHOB|nr:metallophosphoesterase family protein [Rhodoalgimonas zhirmunskyi]MDQ2094510.1 metallophosphatase family protein [Rhodoalgimonas zhirmunskyi]
MPQRLAVIADIHGNADALRAVLDDIDQLGAMPIVNLGDVFSGPLAAREVWALLHDRPEILTVCGNHDRHLIEQPRDAMGPSDRVAFDQLPKEALQWLADLPSVAKINQSVFLCHARPDDDASYLMEQVTPDGTVQLRPENEIAALINSIEAEVILCGHSHQPRMMRVAGRLIVNPGSVGCPAYLDEDPVPHMMETCTPDASYAVIERGVGEWHVCHRHVPYDTARMIALAREAGRKDWASGIATGRIAPHPT